MNQKPSDRLREPARPLRTAGIAVGAAVALVAVWFGGGALAQAFNPVEPVAAEVEVTDEPNAAPLASFSVLNVAGLTIAVDGANSIDPDGDVVSYLWDFGDGQIAEGDSATYAYVAYGTYTVTLTVTDDAGTTGEFSTNVTLIAPPPAAEPPANDGPTYGNYPSGYPVPTTPGTDSLDANACASKTAVETPNGPVCA